MTPRINFQAINRELLVGFPEDSPICSQASSGREPALQADDSSMLMICNTEHARWLCQQFQCDFWRTVDVEQCIISA